MSRAPSRRALALLAAFSFVAALGLAEILLRTLAPLPDPYAWQETRRSGIPSYVPSTFPPDVVRTFRPEDGLPGMTPETGIFTTNNLGFRGDSLRRPKPAGEHRIFLVGGSAFECLYLDDGEEIGHLLQRRLQRRSPEGRRYRVYNGGRSGTRTYDHLALLVHRIVHLEPDLVVVFPGFNDFLHARTGQPYLLPREVGRPEGNTMSLRELVGFTATELQLGRYAVAARSPASSDVEAITCESSYAELAARARSRPLAERPPSVAPEPYARNLRSLAGVAEAQGFDLVFMTQPTTWGRDVDPAVRSRHGMTGFGPGDVRYEEEALDRAMESHDRTTAEVARRRGVPDLELHRRMPKSLEFFYDDVHFNEHGAAFAARVLADFLEEEVLAPAAQ